MLFLRYLRLWWNYSLARLGWNKSARKLVKLFCRWTEEGDKTENECTACYMMLVRLGYISAAEIIYFIRSRETKDKRSLEGLAMILVDIFCTAKEAGKKELANTVKSFVNELAFRENGMPHV